MLTANKDLVMLCMEVERGFKEILRLHLRAKGEELEVPSSLDTAMLLWRTLAVRFRRGDYRYCVSEQAALREIAQWTIDEKRSLCGQDPQVIEWVD